MSKSKLTVNVRLMPETSIFVGSEGDISILDNGKTIRILTAKQARDLCGALEAAADHSEGKLIGDGV